MNDPLPIPRCSDCGTAGSWPGHRCDLCKAARAIERRTRVRPSRIQATQPPAIMRVDPMPQNLAEIRRGP